MLIDTYAYSNRWRNVHPGEKGLFALLCLIAALISSTPLLPCAIAAVMAVLTVSCAGIPLRIYAKLLVLPLFFLLWSSMTLAIGFSPGGLHPAHIPGLNLNASVSRQGFELAEQAFARSLGVTLSLMFLALTTPMTEIMGLLRSLGIARLLIELMMISYRQIFIFLDISHRIRAAQEARLGYSSSRRVFRSLAGLAATTLVRSLGQARNSHLGLLARGYDGDLLFISPRRTCSLRNLIAVSSAGAALIALALTM